MFLNSLGVYLTPENLIWISGVIGFLLPHVAAIIIQSHWKESFKSGLVFLLGCVAAVITCWAKGTLNFSDWVASAGTIFVVARTSYAGLWRPTGIAPAIEAKTNAGTTGTP